MPAPCPPGVADPAQPRPAPAPPDQRHRHAHVAEAAVRAGVPALVVASSVGAYAPGPKDPPVAEGWPVTGVRGSTYSADKAAQESLLDRVSREHPGLRLVRLRPGLIFQRDAGSEIARYFIGPLAPLGLLAAGRLPVLPRHPRLRVQALHADDVADAYAKAVVSDVRGAFNLASAPVLDGEVLAQRFGGVTVPVPPAALVAGAAATWYARLQPTEPGWVRLAAACPLLSPAGPRRWKRPGTRCVGGAARRNGAPHRHAGGALRPRPGAASRAVALLSDGYPTTATPTDRRPLRTAARRDTPTRHTVWSWPAPVGEGVSQPEQDGEQHQEDADRSAGQPRDRASPVAGCGPPWLSQTDPPITTARRQRRADVAAGERTLAAPKARLSVPRLVLPAAAGVAEHTLPCRRGAPAARTPGGRGGTAGGGTGVTGGLARHRRRGRPRRRRVRLRDRWCARWLPPRSAWPGGAAGVPARTASAA